MKIMMLWPRHEDYLRLFYERDQSLMAQSWVYVANTLREDFVSWPSALCAYMQAQGMDVELLFVNDEIGQKKWADERDFCPRRPSDWEREIALAQVKKFGPDVLWLGSRFNLYGDFVREARKYCRKVIAWVGSPFIAEADVDGISVLLTENPSTFQRIQHRFDEVIVTKPGFPRELLSRIGPVEKDFGVTFVGGLSMSHAKRVDVLGDLIRNGIDLKVFGYIAGQTGMHLREALGSGLGELIRHKGAWRLRRNFHELTRDRHYRESLDCIREHHAGFVAGMDMLKVLARSQVTLNIHIDCSDGNAGNMRMFEATGVGTCLVTEDADNIGELFEPEREIVTYQSKEELVERVVALLASPERVCEIAKGGQQKTLREHTIERMFDDIKHAFEV